MWVQYTRAKAHEVWGDVGTVTWGQRIGPQGKVKNRGPGNTYEYNMMPLLERHFHMTLIELVAF
jgi:hypothetical protein